MGRGIEEEEELLYAVRLLMACVLWPLYQPMVDMLEDKLRSTGIWGQCVGCVDVGVCGWLGG